MISAELARNLSIRARPGVPKYVALVDAIVDAVANGKVQPGEKFPTEQELAQKLPLSLGTIQRALRELVTLGVVERRQGHGTFISTGTAGAMAHPFHCRFVDDSGTGYLPIFPKIRDRYLTKEPGVWTDVLAIDEALVITRKIRVADEFNVFSKYYCAPEQVPALLDQSIDSLETLNFKDVIFRTTGLAILRTELFSSVTVAPPHVALELEIDDAVLCTRLRATGHVSDGSPLYYTEIFIPPSRFELHIITDARAQGFECNRTKLG